MEVEKKPKLKLHDSLTDTMEVFEPIDGDNVGMSCCISAGRSHLGLARAAVSSDVLYRYLKYMGYKVTEEARGFIEQYLADIGHLHCLPPTHQLCDSDQRPVLPPKYDIHCGNAIGTTCVACNGRLNYWFHNENPTIENDVEMLQPLEKFLTKDITPKHHPLALRLFFMSTHYGSPLGYSVCTLEKMSVVLDSVYQSLQGLEAVLPHRKDAMHMEEEDANQRKDGVEATQIAKAKRITEKLNRHLENKMLEDLKGILKGDFQEALRMIDTSTKRLKTFKNEHMLSVVVASLVKVEEAVAKVLGVLGLDTTLSYSDFLEQLKQGAMARAELAVQEVLQDKLDLDKMDGMVEQRLAGDRHIFTELMEFITPAGNLFKCVRKSCGLVESEAKKEFDILYMVRRSTRSTCKCF